MLARCLARASRFTAAVAMAVVLLLVLAPRLATASGFPADYWGKLPTTITTTGSVPDASGNTYLTGYFSDKTITLGSVTLTRIGSTDAFVAKLDASGNVLWAKNFGGSGASARGNAVAVDGSGNVYLGGFFSSASLTTPALTKIGSQDAFAFKLTSTGATVWAQNFGGSSGAYAHGRSIAVDGSGNVYLGGYFDSASLTTPALTKLGGTDAFAFKLDSTGATTWAKNFGGSGAFTYGNSITVDGLGNAYLAGHFGSANLTTPNLTRIGTQDTFAFKLDSTGATTWAKNFGGAAGSARGTAVAVDSSRNVYVTGYFGGANLTTPALTRIGAQDAFAFKLDSTGATTWAKNFGGAGSTASSTAIAVDGSGNVYLGGNFYNASLTTPALTLIGAADAFAFKLSSAGATTWAKNFGGSGATVSADSVAADSSGNVYLSGYFTGASLTMPVLALIGAQDAFALKLDSTGATTRSTDLGGYYPGGVVVITAAVRDASGAWYVAGSFTNLFLYVDSATLTRIGSQDAFVAKLDASGNVLWAKNYGGTGANVWGNSIALDGSGNVYLGGYFNGANLTTPALAKIGSRDAFALKLDSAGATTWARNYGGSGATVYGYSVAADSSGNVYLSGSFNAANLTTPALTRIGTQDVFALKLDSTGATTWAKNFGGSGAFTYGYANAVDGSGNVYLGGAFSSANLTTPALTRLGNTDAFAIKLDSSGVTTWARGFGGASASANAYSVAVDGSGNVHLGGYFSGANLTMPSLTLIGGQDAFAIKVDSSGGAAWHRNYGGTGATTFGRAIAIDAAGDVYLSGYFTGANLTTPALTRIGSQDAFAFKLDSTGATTWSKNFGGSGASATAYAVAVDGSGSAYLGGTFTGANLTTPALTLQGGTDGYVIDAQIPSVTSVTGIAPADGTIAGGTRVTITGTGFTGATAVTIGGVAVTSFTVVNATTITATTAPATAGAKNVVVTTPGGTGTGTGIYKYLASRVRIITTRG